MDFWSYYHLLKINRIVLRFLLFEFIMNFDHNRGSQKFTMGLDE